MLEQNLVFIWYIKCCKTKNKLLLLYYMQIKLRYHCSSQLSKSAADCGFICLTQMHYRCNACLESVGREIYR